MAREGSAAGNTAIKRLGRPRADPRPVIGDPREQILEAAAGLFSTVGYTATSTREIAAAAGLRQASLFHYFDRKDDLLAELLDRTVEPALTFLATLGRLEAPPQVALFVLVRRDVGNLCSGPCNLGALQLLPEVRAERFAPFWGKRAQLRTGYRDLVGQGRRCGHFVAEPVELLTDEVFGLVESTIVWYDRAGNRPPDTVAKAVARSALRMLLSDPAHLAALEAEAAKVWITARRRTLTSESAGR